jgi:uncharacterized membrane protein
MSLQFTGTASIFLWIKRSKQEIYHFPSNIADAKNIYIYRAAVGQSVTTGWTTEGWSSSPGQEILLLYIV